MDQTSSRPEPVPVHPAVAELGSRFVADLAEAIARFCTRTGATLDEVASSFCDLQGHTPGTHDTATALVALADDGRVRIAGGRYYWHETDGD